MIDEYRTAKGECSICGLRGCGLEWRECYHARRKRYEERRRAAASAAVKSWAEMGFDTSQWK